MSADPTLYGTSTNNVLTGGDDNDVLVGFGGNDTLIGGGGDDRIIGDSPLPAGQDALLALVAHKPAYTSWAFDYDAQPDTALFVGASQQMLIIQAARDDKVGQLAQQLLWTKPEITTIQASGKEVYGYLDIAKINTFSRMWNPDWNTSGGATPNPTWLGGPDLADKHHATYFVNYVAAWAAGQPSPTLNEDWKATVLTRVAAMRDQGFDGLFLDDPGTFYDLHVTAGMSEPDRRATLAVNARAIRELVLAIHEAAPTLKLIVNGAPDLLGVNGTAADGATDQGTADDAYRAVISAMVAEDYIALNNAYAVDRAKDVGLSWGIPILAADRSQTDGVPLTEALRLEYISRALTSGFLPSVTDNLNTLPASFLDTLAADAATSHNDTIDGGTGLNTAVYTGNFADYQVARQGATVTVTDQRPGAPDGTDTLVNIQTLEFADQSVSTAEYAIVATDANKNEGDSGATAFVFTVERSGGTAVGATIAWSVAGGVTNPVNATDFVGGVLPSGTLTFAPGVLTQAITVNLAGDTIAERDEQFRVALSAPSDGGSITTASATGFVLNDDIIGDLIVLDGGTQLALPNTPSFYTGPAAGIEKEYLATGSSGLVIAATGPNWFIHGGPGTDAIAVAGGTNVIDGGAGSNFLTGADGFDTFFIDTRGATSDIWSSLNSFGMGDAATLWGISAATFELTWVDGEGADGFKGLTLRATAPGQPTASLTLPGFTLAQKAAGGLAVLFNHDTGSDSDYLYVVAT